MPKVQKVSAKAAVELAIFNDLRFPKTHPGADYESRWSPTMTLSNLQMIPGLFNCVTCGAIILKG